MVAHCGETRGDEVAAATNMANGSSSSSSVSGGSGAGVAKLQSSSVLKKGPWTAAEDAILMEYVKKNGEGNWNAVQKNTSLSRCGKSCRLRWTNHLRPNLRKGSFTPDEERLILQLHAQLGNKWARMAAQLPGRTDNEIKNYWNTRIKRRIRQGLPLYMNEFGSQKATSSSPSMQLQDAQTTSAAPIRGRPPLQIPTRSISQFLGQPQMTSSPTPSPIPLSPQSYSHLKSNFNHSLSLFDAASPSTSALTSPHGLPSPHSHGLPSPRSHGLPSPHSHGLSSPHSPVVLPTNISLNSYQDHNASFPGFSFLPTSHLQLPTSSSFRFSPLTFNLNSPQGLQQPPQLPSSVYTKPAELPSNQLYQTQVEKTEYEPQPQYLHQPEPSSRQELDSRPNTGISHSNNISMLENLLHQAETMTQNQNPQDQFNFYQSQDQKFDFSIKSGYAWDDIAIGSDNSSADAGSVIKNEVKEENVPLSEDLSVLLQSIQSPATLLEDYNNLGDNLNNPSMDFGSGMAVAEDGMGLDMQQIASMFQVDSSSGDINPWNNLPRIC